MKLGKHAFFGNKRYIILALSIIIVDALILVAFRMPIKSTDAISVLNDLTIVDGVLIGFVAVMTTENFQQLHGTREELKGFSNLYRHPKTKRLVINGLFDIVIVLCFVVSIMSNLIEITYFGNENLSKLFVLSIMIALTSIVLLVYRLISDLFI